MRALRDLGRPVTFQEATRHIESEGLIALKPGDRQEFATGRKRWQFIASKELGVLRSEGQVTKEGNLWSVAP